MNASINTVPDCWNRTSDRLISLVKIAYTTTVKRTTPVLNLDNNRCIIIFIFFFYYRLSCIVYREGDLFIWEFPHHRMPDPFQGEVREVGLEWDFVQ